MLKTVCPELELLHKGKVRDMYGVPGHDDKLLMVATDRISAYDVVMDSVVPGKGEILTSISAFWFDFLADVADNHLLTANMDEFPKVCQQYEEQLGGRSMLVKKSEVVPVECIVRGYLSGSFWQAYKKDNNVCGFVLPANMQESEKFAHPLFTPSTKAGEGEHDENISFARMRDIVGADLAERMRDISLELYCRAADYALSKGIIIADTKFEFGLVNNEIVLIDEVLTPDSSRFWPLSSYSPGKGQVSFDKQFLRDYLSSLSWNKQPPPPPLPEGVIDKTLKRYKEVKEILLS